MFGFYRPDNSMVGDVLVLTKPLGLQIASNLYRWWEKGDERYKKVSHVMSENDIQEAYKQAVSTMGRLNKTAARLMHKYKAHAATDVTGFGLLGHADNLAKFQNNKVKFVIHTLPVIAKMTTVAEIIGNTRLLKGTFPETSGGLLVSLPKEEAKNYCSELQKEDSCSAWIVGEVIQGDNTAAIVQNPTVIQVVLDS